MNRRNGLVRKLLKCTIFKNGDRRWRRGLVSLCRVGGLSVSFFLFHSFFGKRRLQIGEDMVRRGEGKRRGRELEASLGDFLISQHITALGKKLGPTHTHTYIYIYTPCPRTVFQSIQKGMLFLPLPPSSSPICSLRLPKKE